jgi:hypothetical protein
MRGMTGRAHAGVASIAILLAVTGTALAAPPPGSSLLDRRIYYADQAIEQAGQKVARDRACRFRPIERGAVDGTPSAELLSSLAALRRPARTDENLDLLPLSIARMSVFRDYVRVLTAPDGTSFDVFAMPNVSSSRPRPKRCVSELRRRVHRAVADRSRAFRRVVSDRLRAEISINWSARRREGLLVLVDSGGTMVDLSGFQTHGVFIWRGGETPGARFYALVPDGVATIDFTFRRFEPTGYWSKHHPVTYRTTVAVKDNVLSFAAPLTLRDSAMSAQVWRAADGHVIRVISG